MMVDHKLTAMTIPFMDSLEIVSFKVNNYSYIEVETPSFTSRHFMDFLILDH